MYCVHPYDDALRFILKNGRKRKNRTGVDTLSVFSIKSVYQIDERFPLLTKRKLHPKAVFAELLWMLSGSSNNDDLVQLGANFWTPWVQISHPDNKSFYERTGFPQGYLGPVYGWQMRHFGGDYHKCILAEPGDTSVDWGFDQISWLVDEIKSNPRSRRLIVSMWNPKDMHLMRLPPCFVPGVRISTEDGHKSIECVTIDDKVFTGSGRYRKVNKVYKTQYKGPTLSFKLGGMNVPFTSTENHPFLVKRKHSVFNHTDFVEAKNIEIGDFVAIKRNKIEELPTFKEVIYSNQFSKRKDYTISSLDDWYMIGYFVGDGWHNRKKDSISFSISDKQLDEILPRLRKSIKISKKKMKSVNVHTYETRSKKWSKILSTIGHGASNKRLPAWILNAPTNCIWSFLEGYRDSNGCETKNNFHFVTTSESLAFDLQSLFFKVAIYARIYKVNRKPKCEIEGRVVNQKPTYSVIIPKKERHHKYFHMTDSYLWIKVKSIDKINYDGFVYNLDVEEDHTYTANNIVNHNCHYCFHVDIDDEGRMTLLLNQRSCDFPVGVPANIQFYSALCYMLAQQTGYKPYRFIHHTEDSHIYVDQIEQVEEYLGREERTCPTLNVKHAQDIFSYTMDHFEIVGYDPQPHIKIPVAV